MDRRGFYAAYHLGYLSGIISVAVPRDKISDEINEHLRAAIDTLMAYIITEAEKEGEK